MKELTKIIKSDMVPALGVTEPGAIAFAVASAYAKTNGQFQRVKVTLNKGIYKNAFTCGIPGCRKYGNSLAAALGIVAADPEAGLEGLTGITEEDEKEAQALIDEGKVIVTHNDKGSEIFIEACVTTENDNCKVRIQNGHTSISQIEVNGAVIYDDQQELGKEETSYTKRIHAYTLERLVEYARTVPASEIAFIGEAFRMNLVLFEEGLHSDKTAILHYLLDQNGGKVISEDLRKTAQLLCNGTIEARVLGLPAPAMSITGSGAHGIICTMPLEAYRQICSETCTQEDLLRAAALSYLITMYIKEYSGKLTSFCGCGIAAGTGMACALAFLKGADCAQLAMVIRNMASGITGMICDGGNQGCAMKGITAVGAALDAVDMAMSGVSIEAVHGINGRNPEETMYNIGQIASPGMIATEDTIIRIMEEKVHKDF